MIRTDAVRLSVMEAYAYRRKLKAGDVSIAIVSPDYPQPGLVTIGKKTRDPVPAANTRVDLYPPEAFREAMKLTAGMPFRKQGTVRVTKDMFLDYSRDEEEEVIELDEAAYGKVLDRYTDKNGKLSYDLINKEFISFAKRSSIVRDMVREGKSAAKIRDYIVSNKIRNITGDPKLPDTQIKLIVEMLDDASPKGVFKELNSEIRKMLSKAKKQ